MERRGDLRRRQSAPGLHGVQHPRVPPVEEINANGWRNWKPIKPDPDARCLMCEGWGFVVFGQSGGDESVTCPECRGTITRE